MAETGTLKYYKQYIVLNEDGTVKSKYDDMFEIHNPNPLHLDCELYAVYLKKGDNYGRWGIIDGKGEYVTPVQYRAVAKYIDKNDDVYSIEVKCENDKWNHISLSGREIFAQTYNAIHTSSRSPLCILVEHNKHGLGDLRTGEVILRPWYEEIRYLDNNDLFQVFSEQDLESGVRRWGIIDKTGKILATPQFSNWIDTYEWGDYNLAIGKSKTQNLCRIAIIDWRGQMVYETDAIKSKSYLCPGSRNKAVNAFIFYDKSAKHGKGSARLLVIDYDEKLNIDNFYEVKFTFSRRDNNNSIQRICTKLAKHHNLTEKIYYHSW